MAKEAEAWPCRGDGNRRQPRTVTKAVPEAATEKKSSCARPVEPQSTERQSTMGRKREKKDKAPQRNNYKAEDLLRICYPDNDGGDEVTVNTRRLAGSLPRPVPPKMDNRPIVQPGDQWSDEKLAQDRAGEDGFEAGKPVDLARPLVHAVHGLRGRGRGPAVRGREAPSKSGADGRTEEAAQGVGSTDDALHGRRGNHQKIAPAAPHARALRALRDGHGEIRKGGRHVQRGFGGWWVFSALNSEVTASRLNTFLTQCFNVKLTAEELGATMRWMDYDGNGTIDGSEFLREFWKFGAVEHLRASARLGGAKAQARQQRAARADWMTRFSTVTPATVDAGVHGGAIVREPSNCWRTRPRIWTRVPSTRA